MKMKERLTSWATWLSLLSFIGLVLSLCGAFEKIGMDLGSWDTLVRSFLASLVAFGILNNPTDRNNF